MKYTITVDQNREEEAVIFVHQRTELIDKIEALLKDAETKIIGFKGEEIVPLKENEVFCFIVESNKIYAITEKEKYLIKTRLYKLEEMLGDDFLKINQSGIANFRHIKKFDCSVGGTLKVVFQNGYTDYVSRRNIKKVKERLGI